MTYKEWLATVPEDISGDALWTVEAYRLSLFAADIAWHDSTKLLEDERTMIPDQRYATFNDAPPAPPIEGVDESWEEAPL